MVLAVQLNHRCIEQSVQETSVSQAHIKTFYFSSDRKYTLISLFFKNSIKQFFYVAWGDQIPVIWDHRKTKCASI